MSEDATDFSRAWSTDSEGRQVRTGLSFEETQEYESLLPVIAKGIRAFDGEVEEYDALTTQYFELYWKHETARHQLASAEYELHVTKPTRN